MKHAMSKILAVVLLVQLACEGYAQPGTEADAELDDYVAPVPVEPRPLPPYPPRAARRGAEGWAELSFMVDTDGRPYEIHATASAGDDEFIDAAIATLEETVFTPATFRGTPVDASYRTVYRFELENAGGAGRRFASRYRDFMAALSETSEDEAAEALTELEEAETRNNYEYAYLNLARYSFAQKYGTQAEQMKYLAAALSESMANPEYDSYLQEGTAEARRALAQLQFFNFRFAEVRETLELMRLNGDEEGVGMFGDALDQLAELEANDAPYPVAGQIEANGGWSIILLKNRFYLDDLTGAVDELKLRCQRGYVFFEFDPEIQYSVSENSGSCELEVIGAPGTGFTLVQL